MKILSLALILAFAAPLASAAGGALEINQDCAAVGCFTGDSAGFPVTITQPGSYVLTSDISVTTAHDAIDIQASPVDLDLNGHTLDGGGSCTGTPVSSCTSASDDGIFLNVSSASGHIRIHNGTVHGFGNSGIEGGEAGDGVVFENLTIAENAANGIGLSNTSHGSIAQFRNVNFVRNFPNGLFNFIKVNVENSVFSGNHSYGVSDSIGSTIANTRFVQNGNVGLLSVGPSNSVALDHNVFDHNSGGGSQWIVTTSFLDMGGNVCTDHACP